MSDAGLDTRPQSLERPPSAPKPSATTVGRFGAAAKLLLLGSPLASNQLHRTLLSKVLALPVFSSDALSSVAYASQEILLVLGAAGVGALSLITPISVAVAVLFVVVVVSYRQTVHAYPTGGGAYRVAHENLGVYPGLLAAAALLIDYVLTVAVSVTAGTDALVSAVPTLQSERLPIALVLLAIVAVANLRGARESALAFAIPTYGFVASIFALIVTGFVSCIDGCPQAQSAGLHPLVTGSLSVFLVLRAFAAGTTALTGVEAISNGVPAFREPQSKNAATTLAVLCALAVTMFLGISWLAHVTNVVYTQNSDSTAVAQVAEAVFGRGPMFFVIQIMTAAILVLAANTAYQDFPRLSSILARDSYLPRALMNRGDRLVFSNGIITLALLAGGLLLLFDADLNRLIQLYLVGVFVSFTLSQSGMVRRWWRTRGTGWKRRATANATGALVTGLVLVVVMATKFMAGAWMVALGIPIVIIGMRSIHAHYARVEESLSLRLPSPMHTSGHHAVILLEHLDATAIAAVAHARMLPGADVSAVWMGSKAFDGALWERIAPHVPVVETGHDPAPLRDSLSQLGLEKPGTLTTLVTPLAVAMSPAPHVVAPSGWLRRAVRTALKEDAPMQALEPIVHDLRPVAWEPPPRTTVAQICVLVSSLNASSRRALEFAARLGNTDVRATHIALDPEEAEQLADAWRRDHMDLPLDLYEAPFRHFGASLAEYVTSLRTQHSDGIVIAVVPEVVTESAGRSFLHSHTSRAVRRALLPLSGVAILTVPFLIAGQRRVGRP